MRNPSSQATDATKFRSDVNGDGFVYSGDSTIALFSWDYQELAHRRHPMCALSA